MSARRGYERTMRATGRVVQVQGYNTFTEKVKHGLAILHSTGKATPYDTTPQRAAYESLTPKGQDLYQGLRSLGASHRVAYGRALAKHGKKTSMLERLTQ